MKDFNIPVSVVGPGSQPEEVDGSELDILQLPSGMMTYETPLLPEPEEIAGYSTVKQILHNLQQWLEHYKTQAENRQLSVLDLSEDELKLINQVLGEGEVSLLSETDNTIKIQESVMAGIWRIRQFNENDQLIADSIEIGKIPSLLSQLTPSESKRLASESKPSTAQGVINAPPLISEIKDNLKTYQPGSQPYVINLTLLPQTEQDLEYLQQQLGKGYWLILSRGYGNCRIVSTAVKNVWWVQYFNSQDKNILNTIEIVDVPEVACAAPEDIEDSAQRLAEIIQFYQ